MIHDFIYKPFKLILIHTGATIRFLYHRMVLKEKYSYHAFIINPPTSTTNTPPTKKNLRSGNTSKTNHAICSRPDRS